MLDIFGVRLGNLLEYWNAITQSFDKSDNLKPDKMVYLDTDNLLKLSFKVMAWSRVNVGVFPGASCSKAD